MTTPWTSEKPSQAGWYWYRSARVPAQIVDVYFNSFEAHDKLYAHGIGLHATRVKKLNGQWSGPLPEPGAEK